MDFSRQNQSAGDHSQQIQAQNITINQGISEERVRQIIDEKLTQVLSEYTDEAREIATVRNKQFENSFINRLNTSSEDIKGLLMDSFREPRFQFLLKDAQRSAASSDREDDYKLLTELLVCHVQKGNNRKIRAGVHQAIQIIDDIDNEALCGLTAAHAILHFAPNSGDISEGIQVLDQLFKNLIYNDLPQESGWLDHLDVLGTIRLSGFGKMMNMIDVYTLKLDGYICAGIKTDSDNYKKAMNIVLNAGLPVQGLLVENECLNGYSRIPVPSKTKLENLSMVLTTGETKQLNDVETNALKEIFSIYDSDATKIDQAKRNFAEMWDSHDTLKMVHTWWDSIPNAFTITEVGRVLAHTNAKRCDPRLPDLI